MNALESPVEALLAFNYVSTGALTIVNNIWTWIALITAAVSFWRIGVAAKSLSHHHDPKLTLHPPPPHHDKQPDYDTRPDSDSASASASASTLGSSTTTINTMITSFACQIENDGGGGDTKDTKKFRLYFENDDCETGHREDLMLSTKDCYYDYYYCCYRYKVNDGWDKMLKMRIGEMGWYHYLDMSFLDGNVVRLWG